MERNPKVAFLNLRGSFKAVAFFLLVTTVFSVSCKKDKINDTEVDAAALNVVNASPGLLAISFFLDNQFVNGPALLYMQQSGYILTYVGRRKFDVTVGGTTQVLTTNDLNLEKNKYYTAFFTGTNASPVVVFAQDNLSEPPAGKANIRFINLSPDSQALDLAVKGGAALFSDVAFKAVSEFISIEPAAYILELRSPENTITELAGMTFAAGKVYTVWAKGLLSGSGNTEFSGKIITNR